ncbi:putative transcription factor C2H2 family [Lupinus albus]|uniref:Putative transcription factor C2H2 family n=1 Tax=Lupinus albus TaxID=3870 RepID=A0A6A4QFN0_LUPAL|nr:putative transcription factor C2H2 family [Lupinus albus]
MERHKCKLCSRTFANGRALGGHMKGHFSILPLPPKPQPVTTHIDSASFSFSSSSDDDEEKCMIYELRENPKKSFRLADPKFSFPSDTGSVVQDRESETESKNPTRKRSKRNRKWNQNLEQNKKSKLSLMELSPVSSVSETWPEEDVAMCLMMLSRDTWNMKKNAIVEEQEVEEEKVKPKGLNLEDNNMKLKRVSGKHNNKCDKCGKTFRSSRALGSHKSICSRDDDDKNKIFECPFCYKVFGSGQALGGHKRSHLIQSSNASNHSTTTRFKDTFIDLNLPAQTEEDDLSIVSDA